MFRRVIDRQETLVSIFVNGVEARVPASFTAAAAVLAVQPGATRETPITGAPRAPYCMMGVCFECLLEIDGAANQQGCLVPVAAGMRIERQHGAREAQG